MTFLNCLSLVFTYFMFSFAFEMSVTGRTFEEMGNGAFEYLEPICLSLMPFTRFILIFFFTDSLGFSPQLLVLLVNFSEFNFNNIIFPVVLGHPLHAMFYQEM